MTDPFLAALAARQERATLVWRRDGWVCHQTDLGLRIAGPKGQALVYSWIGIDLADLGLRLPSDRDQAPGTSDIPVLEATKINKPSELAHEGSEPEGGESGASFKVCSESPDSPPPADPEPPRRRQRFLGDPDRGWSPAPLPRGLPW